MGEVRDIGSAPGMRRRALHRLLDDELVVVGGRTAPRQVRHWAMRTVASVGVTGRPNQIVELLTGELVSNAVVHGPEHGEVRVSLGVHGSRVRVEVTDEGAGRPTVLHPDPAARHGRGLALVEALATTWGTSTTSSGTTVWFELDAET